MLKTYFYLFVVSCVFCSNAFAQTTGGLQGQVIDVANKEGLPFANVALEKEGVQISGTQTDFDGYYNFSNIEVGTYDLLVSYVGFATIKTEGIVVKLGQVVSFNIEMDEREDVLTDSTGKLVEIVVRGYRVPLIEQDASTGGQTLGAEDIKNLATRSVGSIVATTAGVSQSDEGEAINSNGARSSSNATYVDGVLMPSGNLVVREDQITPVTTGIPAEYGDVTETIKGAKTAKAVPPTEKPSSEEYSSFIENQYLAVQDAPLSTFSIDVDQASYANIRRYLNQGQKPPKDAIRIEEMINYFDYNYPQPTSEHPFGVITEVADCPWNKKAKLVHIGLQGRTIDLSTAPANNLVFLIDVSGSMSDANKLPLLKASLKLLIDNMRPQDKIALAVYAGAAGLIQQSTNDKKALYKALDRLNAGGSTAGGAGIELAYKIAKEAFVADGNNRVIIATDGDFNVGLSSNGALEKLIVEKRKDDIFLTMLGFGMGNYKDSKMEILADKGNGNYAYIDNIKEAKKTLVNEMSGTLYTIAKDVKLQIEFNPVLVESYRLVGYENRKLQNEDFNDDTKDAGELGAGHTVTAMYEIILAKNYKVSKNAKEVDELKYQKTTKTAFAANSNELMQVKLRYKAPKGDNSILLEQPLENTIGKLEQASENFKWAAAVAGFGMLLRDSEHKNKLTYQEVLDLAKGAKGSDKNGYRQEFIEMVSNVNTMTLHAKK